MRYYQAGDYEVIVVGAGHAGCEAALAAARMGCRTLLLTLSMDNIALMPCNPSIGGPAKAQLVREIDALGGEMGLNIDKSSIQMRTLNSSKGAAVRALRAQADKREYQNVMIATLLKQQNLEVVQAEVQDIEMKGEQVNGVLTSTGARFGTRSLILTTGTYLTSRIIIGDMTFEAGPNGLSPARHLSGSLRELGLVLNRFKTGTPPRVDGRSLDYSKMIEQPGDKAVHNFSYMSPKVLRPQISCWLTHSNRTTHEIVRNNLHRAPMYSGIIEGVGPRHCPAFEDKVVRFADKDAHQIFLEPEGRGVNEFYVQGMNTSLPEDVQVDVLHSIAGLENARIIRTGYAIEYDYLIPTQLKLSLAVKGIKGLFTAGQINGTSGYEEAAAQGLVAGINAVLFLREEEPFIIRRSEGYSGVLIDDLVTKGIDEPYRLLSSSAEYRLILRQDNADLRLTEKGHKVGLASEERLFRLEKKREGIELLTNALKGKSVNIEDSGINQMLKEKGRQPLRDSTTLWHLLRRPEVTMEDIIERIDATFDAEILEQVEIECKYEGYIKKQNSQIERFEALENKRLSEDLDYEAINGLSGEGRYKLMRVRPTSLGQASRISGVFPPDINVLLIHLEKLRRLKE